MTTTMMINQHENSNEIKKEESTLALASAVVAPLYSFYDLGRLSHVAKQIHIVLRSK